MRRNHAESHRIAWNGLWNAKRHIGLHIVSIRPGNDVSPMLCIIRRISHLYLDFGHSLISRLHRKQYQMLGIPTHVLIEIVWSVYLIVCQFLYASHRTDRYTIWGGRGLA